MFATITTDNFSVTSRSHSLGLLPAVYGPDFPLLDMLQQHFAPKTSIVVSTQRQVIQNVERACLWLTTWPRRIKAWHTEHQEAVRTAGNHSHRSTAISKASREAQRISDQAIAAERECRPDLAAELLEKLSRIHPHAETLARLSKQYTDMSYLILQADAAARSSTVDLNIKAVELALKAVATDPTNALGHIALCVSRGRLALVSDNRKKIQLAKDAADDAATAMRLDPYNDYAHHLMGRWHFEMAQLNAVVRTLIRICFGTTLMEGSFSEALSCYRKAAELNPGRVIHRVEIGRTLIKLGNVQAGLEHLQQAIDMDIEDINAKLQQDDAAMLLKKLRAGKREDLYIKNETRS
ncbi:hypothetical protein CEUSTIGMA_g7833.t1 [Chlamydomonas eustigma]|uniref:Regulator of microtubule dynamics protein 1 n=1 Tax=Chlamydomonas eustigma TaxID=1157962 RepID=A0A250XBF4_9CHLO|nr:hypothetical protein CEUSTIGMA_g7833.t1 [Chlamydomonas eustigma]|eukprot:GAX80394.1 hypothetical protein CEUSTIGMA_g7833.t1 [Chlamydomonas eustigma]